MYEYKIVVFLDSTFYIVYTLTNNRGGKMTKYFIADNKGDVYADNMDSWPVADAQLEQHKLKLKENGLSDNEIKELDLEIMKGQV